MPKTAHPMTSISAALQDLRKSFEGLVADHAHMRQQLQALVGSGWSVGSSRRGRPVGRPPATHSGKKLGRAFKFSDDQAAEFRKQVEGGKTAFALAKELKISLPTMYNTLKRAGWAARHGRPSPTQAARSSGARGAKKRGRAFKFSSEQATEFRKQAEGGKSAVALAKELKVSLPTMYNTLRRAGWKGRPGRKAKAA